MTPREELMALLDRERDGSLDVAARARLAALLASHPGLADEARELRALGDLFASVEPVSVPAGFAAQVLREVGVAPARGRLLRLAPLLSATAAAALVIGLFVANRPDARDGGPAAETAVAGRDRSRAGELAERPAASMDVVTSGPLDPAERVALPDVGASSEPGDAGAGPPPATRGAPGPSAAKSAAPAAPAPPADAVAATPAAEANDTPDSETEEKEGAGLAAGAAADGGDADEDLAGDRPAREPAGFREVEHESERLRRADEPVFWITEVGGARYAVFTDAAAARAYAARLGAGASPATATAPPAPARAPAESRSTRGQESAGRAGARAGAPAAVTVVADLVVATGTLERVRRGMADGVVGAARPEADEVVDREDRADAAQDAEAPGARRDLTSLRSSGELDALLRARVAGFIADGRRAASDDVGFGGRGGGAAPAGGGGGPTTGGGGAGAGPTTGLTVDARESAPRRSERVVILLVETR